MRGRLKREGWIPSEIKADERGRVLLLSAVVRQALIDYVHDRARGVSEEDTRDAEFFLFNRKGLESILERMEYKGINLSCIRAFARYGRINYRRDQHPASPEQYLNRLLEFRKTWVSYRGRF